MSISRRMTTCRTIRLEALLVAAVVLSGTFAQPSGAYPRPGQTQLVTTPIEALSVPIIGRDSCSGNGAGIDMTPDARYLTFATPAGDLVEGDTNEACDVFRKNLKTGKTIRVSVASSGAEARIPGLSVPPNPFPDSVRPSISADGRYIAFASWAQDLADDDDNAGWDVFVHDVRKKTTMLVSRSSDGDLGNDFSIQPSIDGSGRLIVYRSYANNLLADGDEDDDAVRDSAVLLYDRHLQRTSLVSEPPDADTDLNEAGYPTISANGQFVLFVNENAPGVYVRDLERNKTTLVAASERPINAGDQVVPRAIDSEGRYITFSGVGDNFVPNDRNYGGLNPAGGGQDVFVLDLESGRIERVSVNRFGEEAPKGHANDASLSPDGRYVSFASEADFYSPQEGPAVDGDLYVHDRQTGALVWASVDKNGGDKGRCSDAAPATQLKYSSMGILSRGARYVLFSNSGSCLVDDDEHHTSPDVFLRDMGLDVGAATGGTSPDQDPPSEEVCITEDVCIPPLGVVVQDDGIDDVDALLTGEGANISGASLAYRTQYEDLFATIELEYMPQVTAGLSPIYYGLRFNADGATYEVRATSLLGGTFGLFDCTDRADTLCSKVADLRGGYGTTGMRVVFSLPLAGIGLENGGEISDVEAFSAMGSYLTGAVQVLDRVAIR